MKRVLVTIAVFLLAGAGLNVAVVWTFSLLRPTWPAFAINTIFYAALLGLLIYGPALRRFLRVRRGLCPKCAYPMGESAVCSECGQALPRAS